MPQKAEGFKTLRFSGGGSYETTLEERIQIVRECISCTRYYNARGMQPNLGVLIPLEKHQFFRCIRSGQHTGAGRKDFISCLFDR